MRLQVKGKNVEVTPSIREYAERKLARLGKQLAEQTQVEVELSEQRNPSIADSQVAEATVFTKGPTLRATRVEPRHEGVDRPARRQARAPGRSATREQRRVEPRRHAPAHGETPLGVALFRRRKPLHERLAEEGGLVELDGARACGPASRLGR